MKIEMNTKREVARGRGPSILRSETEGLCGLRLRQARGLPLKLKHTRQESLN
jgi:hypothetical protein